MKTAVVCGAGGFIGGHLVRRLKSEGYWVLGVDLKPNTFRDAGADEFLIGDLRDRAFCSCAINRPVDELYQLAADMGGAGYIFVGDNDADIMHNSAQINLNVLDVCKDVGVGRVFYSSSACVYPESNQLDPETCVCREDTAYPAAPDSEYGWEKLFSERLYLTYARCHGIKVRIARFHNIFGPDGVWDGGREKAPAAICRKVAAAQNGGSIEIWGDGQQTRSFLFVEECIEATLRLMRSEFSGPFNIGSEEMVSIDELAHLAIKASGKNIGIEHISGPLGVRARNSHNQLIGECLKWQPTMPLSDGIQRTYDWINAQIRKQDRIKRYSACQITEVDSTMPLESQKKLTLLMPVHNEAGIITRVVHEWLAELQAFFDSNFEILICEDGSRDGTKKVIKKLAKMHPEICLNSVDYRRGYGNAIIEGLEKSRGEYILIGDSDGQISPQNFRAIWESRSNAAVIMGRRAPRNDTLFRKAISRLFYAFHVFLFGFTVRDPSCPFVLLKTKNMKRLEPLLGFTIEGFWWGFAGACKKMGIGIYEVDVRHQLRLDGETQVYSFRKIPGIALRNIWGLIRLRFVRAARAQSDAT